MTAPAPTKRTPVWQILAGVIISAVLIFFSFRGVNFREVLEYVRSARTVPIVLGVTLATLTFVLRIFRWQLLLKGYDEVRAAPDPLIAAKMALLRVLHAQDLPDPGKLAKRIEELAASGGAAFTEQAGAPATAPASRAETLWPALVDRVEHSGQLRVAQVMRDWVRVIALQPGELTCAIAPGYPGDPGAELRDALLRATGERWQVIFAEGEAQPTLRELADAAKAAGREAMMRHPLVETAFATFPRAELIEDEAEVRDVAQTGRKWSRRL